MPVKNGIEVAKEIRKLYPEPVIIYVTNHLNYAVEAYEVNTYRYIAKESKKRRLYEKVNEFSRVYTDCKG